MVKFWLREEGIDSGEVFVDVESIEAGDKWPEKIREALAKAKCLIPVLSAPYFQSKWCLSEWRSFKERERVVGSKLIVPVVFHDGDYFPADALETQWFDLKEYAFTQQSFWGTPRSIQLEAEIKKVCVIARKIVQTCPACENWPIIEVNEIPKAQDVRLMKL